MNEPKPGWTDQQVEQFIGDLLRWGVILAASVVLIGGVIHLAHDATAKTDFEHFQGEPAQFRTLGGIIADALALDGKGIIQLGLLLLIAVPVARVAFSVLAFAAQRDRAYVVITLGVLGVLLFSLFVGRL